MDRKRKKWTEEEDLVVVSLMREHSGNVCEVAELASRELGRTPMAVAARWYGKLQPGRRATGGVSRSGKRVVVGGGRDSRAGHKDSFIRRLIKLLFGR